MKSWKTTLSGIIALLAVIVWAASRYLNIATPELTDPATAIAAVSAAIGLIFARDNSKSSEDVGAK